MENNIEEIKNMSDNEKVVILNDLKTLSLAQTALLHQSDVSDDHWMECPVDLYDVVAHVSAMINARLAVAKVCGFLDQAMNSYLSGQDLYGKESEEL